MSKNPYLQQQNGGALSPEATHGRVVYSQMQRKKPKKSLLARQDADERSELDIPDRVNPDDLRRAYLVDIRVLERGRENSSTSYPVLRAFYCFPEDLQSVHIQTAEKVREQDGKYLVGGLDDLQSSILSATDGESPMPWLGTPSREIARQHRAVLENQHEIELAEEA